MGKTTSGSNDGLLATMHQILSEQTPDFVEFDDFKVQMQDPASRKWAYDKVKSLFPETMTLDYEAFDKQFEKKSQVQTDDAGSGSKEEPAKSELSLPTEGNILDIVKTGVVEPDKLITAKPYNQKVLDDKSSEEMGLKGRITINNALNKANEDSQDGSKLVYEQSRENSLVSAMNQYSKQLDGYYQQMLDAKKNYESYLGNPQYDQAQVKAGLQELNTKIQGWDKFKATEMLKFGSEQANTNMDKQIALKRAQLAAAKPYWEEIKAKELEINKLKISLSTETQESTAKSEDKVRQLSKERNDLFFSMLANTTNNLVFYDTDEYKPTILMHPTPDDFLKFMLASVNGQEYADKNFDYIRNGTTDEQRVFWAKIQQDFSRQFVEHGELVGILKQQGMDDIAEMFTVSKGTHAVGEFKKGALDIVSKTLKGGAVQQAGVFDLFMTPNYASQYLQMTTKADADFMAKAKATSMPKSLYNEWYEEKKARFGENGLAVMGIKSYDQLHANPLEPMLLYQVGESVDDWISGKVKTNPRWKDSWWLTSLPNGAGSMVGYMGMTAPALALGGNAGGIIVAGVGTLQMIGSTYDEAINSGATYEQAMSAALSPLNILAGASEAVPISSFFARLAKTVPLETALYSFLSRTGVQSLEEGTQEFFQTVANNMTAREYYDFSRDIMAGVKDSVTVGMFLGGIMGAMSIRVNDSKGKFSAEDIELIKEINKEIEGWAGSNPDIKDVMPEIEIIDPVEEPVEKPAEKPVVEKPVKPEVEVEKPKVEKPVVEPKPKYAEEKANRKAAEEWAVKQGKDLNEYEKYGLHPISEYEPTFRGTTMSEWEAIKSGGKAGEFTTPSIGLAGNKGAWGKAEVVIEFKPEAKSKMVEGDEKFDSVEYYVKNGELTLDDVQKVTTESGQVIYDAEKVEPTPKGELENGSKIQWNVFGNEEMGEWTVKEKTKTRGGKDAVVLSKVYVESSIDGKSYTKEYADANGIKYDNERTVEHIVPLEDLQQKPVEPTPENAAAEKLQALKDKLRQAEKLMQNPGFTGDVTPDIEKLKKDIAEKNAKLLDKDSKHIEQMSLQELRDLAKNMDENQTAYQDMLDDATGVYAIVTDKIEELTAEKPKEEKPKPIDTKALVDEFGGRFIIEGNDGGVVKVTDQFTNKVVKVSGNDIEQIRAGIKDFIKKNPDNKPDEISVDDLEGLLADGLIDRKTYANAKSYMSGKQNNITKLFYEQATAKFNERKAQRDAANKDNGADNLPPAAVKKTEKGNEGVGGKEQPKTASGFVDIPIADLQTDLEAFQGREGEFSTQTVDRIVSENERGVLNRSAIPPIQIWKDPATDKWVILGGHSRTEGLKRIGDKTIKAQIVEAATKEEAKKIAQESNAGAVQTPMENAAYLRNLRVSGMSKGDLRMKAKTLYGADSSRVLALSYLNPKGKIANAMRALATSGNVSSTDNINKIAKWVGEVRSRVDSLTDAHENEMYDWLLDEKVWNKMDNKELNFLQHITGITQRIDFDPEEPLNLANLGTNKDYVREEWEKQVTEKEEEVKAQQKFIKEKRQKFLEDPTATPDAIAKALEPYEAQLIRLQQDLAKLKMNKDKVIQAGKGIISLFDQVPEGPIVSKEDLENRYDTLGKISERLQEIKTSIDANVIKLANGGTAALALNRDAVLLTPDERKALNDEVDLLRAEAAVLADMLGRMQDIGLQKKWKKVYRGYGRQNKDEIYEALKVPALGAGLYYTHDVESAKMYGPKIEEIENPLKNPLIINNDDEWKALVKETGWEIFGKTKEQQEEITANLKKVVMEKGYDGIIVTWDETQSRKGYDGDGKGTWWKTINRVFGHPTLVNYNIPEKKSTPDDDVRKAESDAEKAKARLKELLKKGRGKLNTGFDPEILLAAVEYGSELVKLGYYKFRAWSHKMLTELSEFRDIVEPNLKDIWESYTDDGITLEEFAAERKQSNPELEKDDEKPTGDVDGENTPPPAGDDINEQTVFEILPSDMEIKPGLNKSFFGRANFRLPKNFVFASRKNANAKAEFILNKLRNGQSTISKDELAELAQYTGRGNMPEYLEGKVYEHFTPIEIYNQVFNYLFSSGVVDMNIKSFIEPAGGIGRAFMAMPEFMTRAIETGQLEAISIDLPESDALAISKVLFPSVRHFNRTQDKVTGVEVNGLEGFAKSNQTKADLIVTNVPFDSKTKYKGYELHDGFIIDSLKLLKPGGVGVFITTTMTADKEASAARREMLANADIVDIIRLAPGEFKESASTMVPTDILIFRKPSKKDVMLRNFVSKLSEPAKKRISDNEQLTKTDLEEVGKIAERFSLETTQEATDAINVEIDKQVIQKKFLQTGQFLVKDITRTPQDSYTYKWAKAARTYIDNAVADRGSDIYQIWNNIKNATSTYNITDLTRMVNWLKEDAKSKASETFPIDAVLKSNPAFALIFSKWDGKDSAVTADMQYPLDAIARLEHIREPWMSKRFMSASVSVNTMIIDNPNLQIMFSQYGPRAVVSESQEIRPSQNPNVYKSIPDDAAVRASMRVGDYVLRGADNLPNGSILVEDGIFYRKTPFTATKLQEIALTTIKDKFGEKIADAIKNYQGELNFKSLLEQSDLKKSAKQQKRSDRIDTAEYSLGKFYTLANEILGENEKVENIIALAETMMSYWEYAKGSLYVDITAPIEKAGDIEMVTKFMKDYDEIIKYRDTLNNKKSLNDEKDYARLELKAKISDVISENKIKNLSEHPALKYFKTQDYSDNRIYVLAAFDNIITDAAGRLRPESKWGGILASDIAFSQDVEIDNPTDLIKAFSTHPGFNGKRINAEQVYKYIRTNYNTELAPRLSASLQMQIVDGSIESFVDQVTKGGEYMVDYESEQELAFITIEDFAVGNVVDRIRLVEERIQNAQAVGAEINHLNSGIALDRLYAIKQGIPEIPIDEYEFDIHSAALNFTSHVIPYIKSIWPEITQEAFLFNRSSNEGHGKWEMNPRIGNLQSIMGYSISSKDISKEMVVNWVNRTSEIKPLRDANGEIVYKEGRNGEREVVFVDDTETTTERNVLMNSKFNSFLKEALAENERTAIEKKLNENYAFYQPAQKTDAIDIPGLTTKYKGEDLFVNPWQWGAVHDYLNYQRLYANHAVGAGKTMTSILMAAAAKSKSMISKPMFVVPLKTIPQWKDEIKALFPNAKILTIRSENKEQALADLSVQQYDYVLLANSTFQNAIRLSAPKQIEYMRNDLKPMYEAIDTLLSQIMSITDKSRAKEKKKLETQYFRLLKFVQNMDKRIQDLIDRSPSESTMSTFDNMGVDALFVDEADEYKNVITPITDYGEIKGINSSSSPLAINMRFITRYVQEQRNNKNVVYLTATPVSNSATEIYQSINALAPDLLLASGIRTFSDFVNEFGIIKSEELMKTSGNIEPVNVFSGIKNLPSLHRLIQNVFSVITQEEMDDIKRKQGKPIPRNNPVEHTIALSPEREFAGYYQIALAKVVKALAKLTPSEKKERSAEAERLRSDLELVNKSIKQGEKSGWSAAKMKELKERKADIEARREQYIMNSLTFYGMVKGGIVHPKLFDKHLDDSHRDSSKLNYVSKKVAEAFDYQSEANIVEINGRKYFDLGVDEYGNPIYRIVEGGQLFFAEVASSKEDRNFNAIDAYIEQIKKDLPDTVQNKDLLFMKIDMESSKPVSEQKLREVLKKYYADEAEINQAIDKITASLKEVEEETVMVEDPETGEMVPLLDDEGNPVQQGEDILSGKPSMRMVAQYLFNNQKVRFLFGSTMSMGVGMNLQDATTDIWHLDMPFRPRDFIQRNGRGVRQGNRNSAVNVHTIVSEGGPEALVLQLLRVKQKFISVLFNFMLSLKDNVVTGETASDDSVLLNQLDNMIKNSQDYRVREYVQTLKEVEALLNKRASYIKFQAIHERNVDEEQRLVRFLKTQNQFIETFSAESEKIEAKVSEQKEYDKEFRDTYKKTTAEDAEYSVKLKELVDKYEPFINDADFNKAQASKSEFETLKQALNKQYLPERKFVPDYTYDEKVELVMKARETAPNTAMMLAKDLFMLKTTKISKEGEQTAVFNYVVDTGQLSTMQIDGYLDQLQKKTAIEKKMVSVTHFESSNNQNALYTLEGLLAKINMQVGTFKRGSSSTAAKHETLVKVMNTEEYKSTLQSAVEAFSGTPENPETIDDKIAAAQAVVNANKPAYARFVTRQEKLADYAMELLDWVIPNIKDGVDGKTAKERIAEIIDEWKRVKTAYETSDADEDGNLPELKDIRNANEIYIKNWSSTQDNKNDDGGDDDGGGGGGLFDMNEMFSREYSDATGAQSYTNPVGTNANGTYITIQQISRNLIKNLEMKEGWNVRAGNKGARLLPKTTLGRYYNGLLIRLRGNMADFQTLAHEIGHSLDLGRMGVSQILSDRSAPRHIIVMAEELISADAARISASKGYSGITREGRIKEGFAEFIRKYIVDPAQAVREHPTFLPWFENLMNEMASDGWPQIRTALNSARAEYDIYLKNPAVYSDMIQMRNNRSKVNLADIGYANQINGFLGRVRNFTDKFNLMMKLAFGSELYPWDEFIRLPHIKDMYAELGVDEKELVKGRNINITTAINQIAGIAGIFNNMIERPFRRIFADDNSGTHSFQEVPIRGLKAILQPFVDKGVYNFFEQYLRNRRIMTYMERQENEDRALLLYHGEKLTRSHELIKHIEEQIAWFENEVGEQFARDSANDVSEWTKLGLYYMLDGGLITQDEFNAMTTLNSFYVPFQTRTEEDFGDGMMVTQTYSPITDMDTRNPLKSIKAIDFANIDEIESPIDMAEKNLIRQIIETNKSRRNWELVNLMHELQAAAAEKDVDLLNNAIIQRIPSKEVKYFGKDANGEPIFKRVTSDPKDSGIIVIPVINRDVYTPGGEYRKDGAVKMQDLSEKYPDPDDIPYTTKVKGFKEDIETTFYQIPAELYKWLRLSADDTGHADHEMLRKFLNAQRFILNTFRRMTVRMSLSFVTRNIFRDTQSAMLYVRHSDYNPLTDPFRALTAVLKDKAKGKNIDDLTFLMNASGADLSASIMWDEDGTVKYKPQTKARSIAGLFNPFKDTFIIPQLAQASEMFGRRGAYLSTLRETGRTDLAAIDARNSAGDFYGKRKGYVSRFLDKAVPFKAIQFWHFMEHIKFISRGMKGGYDMMADIVKHGQFNWNKDFGKLMYAMLWFAAADMMAYMGTMLGMPGDDDDDKERRRVKYQQSAGWFKYGMMHIPLPGGKSMPIPKSPLNILFASGIQAYLNNKNFKDETAQNELRDYATTFNSAFVPYNFIPPEGKWAPDWGQFLPYMFQPVLEVQYNYDAFRNAPIVPRYMQDLRKEQQYYSSTDHVYRWMSSLTTRNGTREATISPLEMQHIVEGYTAGVGRYVAHWASVGLTGEVSDVQQLETEYLLVPRFWQHDYALSFGNQSASANYLKDFIFKSEKAQKNWNEAFERMLTEADAGNTASADEKQKYMKSLENDPYYKIALISEMLTGDAKSFADKTDAHLSTDITYLKKVLSVYAATYDQLQKDVHPGSRDELEAVQVEMTKKINEIAVSLRNILRDVENKPLEQLIQDRQKVSENIIDFGNEVYKLTQFKNNINENGN
ncbi:MAG TPA: DEAD/DEAH box helicase family protein [Chitinophagales bacterium]|nr:DEAD/DEAH box helicase family protein [Chitinophagales bacterium]